MLKKTQFTGKPFPGILHQVAQRVNVPERGIAYDRPERFVVNTPFGQMEITAGDWLVEFSGGNRYVFKPADMAAFRPLCKKPWWNFGRRV